MIPLYGGFGAAIATVISYVIVSAVRVADVRKKIHLKIQWERVSVQIVLVILMAVFETFVEIKGMYFLEAMCLLGIVLSDVKLIKNIFNSLVLKRSEE